MLQNNAADPLPIAADGPFVFATALTESSSYSVTVQHHPDDTNQYCSVTNGAGVVATTDVGNVLVTCSIREEIILDDGFENPPDP